MERRHVHRERDLAELLSAVRYRERNSQLLSLSDAAYKAGLRRSIQGLDAAAAAEREEALLAIRRAGRKKKRKGH